MTTHEPKIVFKYFDEITKIPRPSKKEEKIIAYLESFAKEHGLKYKKDKVGNIVMKKPATPGMEDRKSIIMQSHVDMVCEKNNDVDFNFETDAIRTKVVDGWLKAEGTTLGADNGIGVATQLAIMASNDIEHGPIEALFTVDEETGLTGAMNVEAGFFDSDILLNLDSEDEGEMFIGCAGGMGTMAEFYYEPAYADPSQVYIRISVSGLRGGHSGGDIHLGRANAVKVLARALYGLADEADYVLASIQGGNLHNAIPREAHAVIGIESKDKETVAAWINTFSADIHNEYKKPDPELVVTATSDEKPEFIIDSTTSAQLVNALIACPHGVLGMSHTLEGLVETSNNLASVKMKKAEDGSPIIYVETSQRSSVESAKRMVGDMVTSVFDLAGAYVSERDGYPGWEPNNESEIMGIALETYKELFGKEPKITAIHAGLECGLFKEKYPHLDMLSFGPTMRDVHSPEERLEIATVDMWWKHLLAILKKAPKKA
ncbi:Cytosol non-specific dipeptidase [Porphyromonas levii]|uniref:Cytosol non-specific dipeptidase n=1 Tax=Porphyromonas levii TaxID=28114 RepID=A0A4Y8WPS1_9PORP|nr:aminoacyl-histidine dipeptidase [Porphyromonas levii]MBR8730675.1 Cytosol non-specific dipeptidase [Porphyromonas levii]MBR8784360.1 Cytosol non-specific dipeptidase [Porphyromonas levii]TFH95731.1 aminoacyl-histidine dipeptidase [Porphyromonas levii]TFH96103.1 aminoacyl-histidine dipeptidase [Porphyromonas levii]